MLFHRKLLISLVKSSSNSRRSICKSVQRFDAAYDGPGKTTVNILNDSREKLMINGISQYGFLLNNDVRVIGPIIIFPDAIFQWKIKSALDVTADSLCIFDLINPKPDIIFFGYGASNYLASRNVDEYHPDQDYQKKKSSMLAKLVVEMRKRKINIEVCPTEDAISAFNYLIDEDRLVAAALIPPEEVKTYPSDSQRISDFHQKRDFGDYSGTSQEPLIEDFTFIPKDQRQRKFKDDSTDFHDEPLEKIFEKKDDEKK